MTSVIPKLSDLISDWISVFPDSDSKYINHYINFYDKKIVHYHFIHIFSHPIINYYSKCNYNKIKELHYIFVKKITNLSVNAAEFTPVNTPVNKPASNILADKTSEINKIKKDINAYLHNYITSIFTDESHPLHKDINKGYIYIKKIYNELKIDKQWTYDEFYKYVQTITGIVYNKDKQMIKLI